MEKKASAKGWRRQMVDLLGYERVVNAITLARVRARQQLDVTAKASSSNDTQASP